MSHRISSPKTRREQVCWCLRQSGLRRPKLLKGSLLPCCSGHMSVRTCAVSVDAQSVSFLRPDLVRLFLVYHARYPSGDSHAGFTSDVGPGVAEHRAGGEGGVPPVRTELRAGGHALLARLALQHVVDPEVGVGAGRRSCVGGGLPIGDLGTRTLDVLTDRAVAGGGARRPVRQCVCACARRVPSQAGNYEKSGYRRLQDPPPAGPAAMNVRPPPRPL